MLLKPPESIYHPGTPGTAGTPEQPAIPERTVCGYVGGVTETVRICSTVRLWAPASGIWSVALPPGTVSYTYGEENGRGYVDCYVCRTETRYTVPPTYSCVTYPAVPYKPATPPTPPTPPWVESRPRYGWDAGANSRQELDGDVFVRFTQPVVVGVVTGFTHNPDAVPDPTRISHGFYFYTDAARGQSYVQVYEAGITRGGRMVHYPEDEFRIQRVKGEVSYWCGGERVYTSATPSTGPVRVGTSLFATGDQVPTAKVRV